MFKHKRELLLIGPRQSKNGDVGGVVVLFENLIRHLNHRKIKHVAVDSNSINYSHKLIMFLVVSIELFKVWRYDHISLNGTARDYLYFAPHLLIINLVFRKRYSLRKFAGNFDEYHASLSSSSRFLVNLLLNRSSGNFFETLELVEKFNIYNSNTFWFPNVRPPQTIRAVSLTEGEVFKVLYLSQVTRQKGVLDLINAVNQIDNVNLTIAGPIKDEKLSDLSNSLSGNIEYVGPIDNKKVYEFISHFHCLALPTFYAGEGYPGAIIEAFMVGLPVISTRWRQIPELVDTHGLLIEPRSISELIAAISEIREKHSLFQEKSIQRSNLFIDSAASDMFLEKINL